MRINQTHIIIFLVLLLIGAGISIVFLDYKLREARLQSKAYKEKQEQLKAQIKPLKETIAAREKRIQQIESSYDSIPKDNEIIIRYPIKYVTVNDEWTTILNPIEQAINSTEWGYSAVPDETAGSGSSQPQP